MDHLLQVRATNTNSVSVAPEVPAQASTRPVARAVRDKKIWIDLDNSPHVPFFAPIIEELEKRGYPVVLTARDCFQVRELSDLFGFRYQLIGHHYGKNKIAKFLGLCIRALQMVPATNRAKPSIAVSHGSRSQLLVSKLLGIRSVTITDYEFATLAVGIHPDWMIVPDVIADDAVKSPKSRVLKYPGIKEDVYVPNFIPQPELLSKLGLAGPEVIVTVRPPATEAHYHVPESDELFEEVLNYLGGIPQVKMVLLPRNERQASAIRSSKPDLFSSGKIIIPEHVVDGLNLAWFSDLVISGGGTMNREAAALGVPVYSIFRGKIGAVDHYLAASGRLTLIESREQVHTKLNLVHRNRPARPAKASHAALEKIVEHIVAIVEGQC
ncbi:MAG: DUF354 domain-containing protein [Acidobacteriia bacterium]|nr:DUF354 domain-containing protein [Terriglobia bacterium]